MAFRFLYHLGLIALFSVLNAAVAQTNYRNISLGQSLTASDDSASWPSPSGHFAFGFRRLENQNLYLLSIWFDKIPNKTIVWYANGDKPAPKGSKVELRTDGLILMNPGGEVIWRPKSSPVGVIYAAMLDTGNFILAQNDYSNVWQSFDEPADTLLPAQILRVNRSVSARTTENNFTRGRFELRLIPDGNLVLNTIALPTGNAYEAYYWSNTVDKPGGMTGNQLIFDALGYLYIVKTNGDIVNVTSGNIGAGFPTRNYYHRATIDYGGVLRLYAHPRSSRNGRWDETWFTVWFAPNDICAAMQGERGGGTCGFNSYCSTGAYGRPNCQCLPGFSFSDPSNELNGCQQDAIPNCNLGGLRPEDLYVMQKLDNLQWSNASQYEELHPFSDDDCSSSCLYDCHCFLAISVDGNCRKKKLPVSNGRTQQTGNTRAFVKMLISNISSGDTDTRLTSGKRSQNAFSLIAAVLLGSSGFLNFLLVAAILLIVRSYDGRNKLRRLPSLLDSNLRTFTYEDLKVATDKFKEELGRGSFGFVYKGILPLSGSQILVAIKKLNKIEQEGEQEFKTEASVIAKIHHKNLVRLIGLCDEGPHKLLVYEFMSNGSLASHLFGDSRPGWGKRIQFAFGIARGLFYLHEECSTQIIHCDVKPQNVLLDDSFTAKISDFGLAKLLLSNQSRTLTGIRGTKGYVAPEWFKNTPVTTKVDVYSYGVLLLEIICCRKCVDMERRKEEEIILIDWVSDCYKARRLDKLVEDDEEATCDMRQLENLVMVAIWCIQEDPNLRPSIKMVINMLEGVVQVSAPPCPSSHSSVY